MPGVASDGERDDLELASANEAEADPATRVDALLDWLEANRYLSNERFVESRVHARVGKFGNLRIRQELGRHQLALPADTAQALGDTEFDRASSVRQRKFAVWPASPAERAKQARFLAARGFSPEVIGRLLRRGSGDSSSSSEDDGAHEGAD